MKIIREAKALPENRSKETRGWSSRTLQSPCPTAKLNEYYLFIHPADPPLPQSTKHICGPGRQPLIIGACFNLKIEVKVPSLIVLVKMQRSFLGHGHQS